MNYRVVFLLSLLLLTPSGSFSGDAPFQATGIKIGEVTDSSAIIWTRLTRYPERVDSSAAVPVVSYLNPETGAWQAKPNGRPDWTPRVEFPDGAGVESIEGAVPGMPGQVRVRYKDADASDWQHTDWRAVDPERDYTCQFRLRELEPNRGYLIRVESRAQDRSAGQVVAGKFLTAPEPDTPEQVVFTVSTGQAYNDHDLPGRGYKIYAEMLKLDPSFFVHTGDIVYYDRLAKTAALARWHWQRTYSLPSNVNFHRNVASYFIKDDHDTWMNDCWPGQQTRFMGTFTFVQGQAIFREQVPMAESTYRTVRWGKDLQIWLMEGRDSRSPNNSEDGPAKTIWGDAQKKWFEQSVAASDATFRILISPTPIVGPDRQNKNDNHANAGFSYEGDELRAFIATQNNMVVICGDRHWQYVSVDQKTGIREYSCGPASDAHAGGWRNEYLRPEHRYLNVTGGFLAVSVERSNGESAAIFQHYSVDGELLNEDILPAN
jgi:alkaline phosphatase D